MWRDLACRIADRRHGAVSRDYVVKHTHQFAETLATLRGHYRNMPNLRCRLCTAADLDTPYLRRIAWRQCFGCMQVVTPHDQVALLTSPQASSVADSSNWHGTSLCASLPIQFNRVCRSKSGKSPAITLLKRKIA